MGKSDPFCEVSHGRKVLLKTKIIKNTLNPTWNEDFMIKFDTNDRSPLIIRCYDWDRIGSNDFLGEAKIELATLRKPGSYEVELGKGEINGRKKSYFKYVGGKLKILVIDAGK